MYVSRSRTRTWSFYIRLANQRWPMDEADVDNVVIEWSGGVQVLSTNRDKLRLERYTRGTISSDPGPLFHRTVSPSLSLSLAGLSVTKLSTNHQQHRVFSLRVSRLCHTFTGSNQNHRNWYRKFTTYVCVLYIGTGYVTCDFLSGKNPFVGRNFS